MIWFALVFCASCARATLDPVAACYHLRVAFCEFLTACHAPGDRTCSAEFGRAKHCERAAQLPANFEPCLLALESDCAETFAVPTVCVGVFEVNE